MVNKKEKKSIGIIINPSITAKVQCHRCKHYDTDSFEEPCKSCVKKGDGIGNFEPCSETQRELREFEGVIW